MTKEIILRSSYADITVERQTGKILNIDYSMGGTDQWDDVERFDPVTLPDEPETDVLHVGFYLKGGAYVEACPLPTTGEAA